MLRRVATALLLAGALPVAGALPGCSPYYRKVTERLDTASAEELCGRRANLVTGAPIRRELALRGEDCALEDAEARRGAWFGLGRLFESEEEPAPPVAYGALQTRPSVALDPPPPPPAPAVPAAPWATGTEPPPAAAAEPPAPEPPAPEPARGPTPPTRTAAAATVAPLVTPGCVERSVARGEGTEASRRAVSFRNRCDFPIRVRYAARSDGRLTEVTEPIAPGATSRAATIEAGFDFPGFVVCGYREVPETALCR
jgi:hypothetical protein